MIFALLLAIVLTALFMVELALRKPRKKGGVCNDWTDSELRPPPPPAPVKRIEVVFSGARDNPNPPSTPRQDHHR